MTSRNEHKFDLEKYIEVSSNFSSTEQSAIKNVLSDIAKFKDSEGKQLIESAYALHGKIVIMPTLGATHFTQTNGTFIYINFNDCKTTLFQDRGKTRHVSLTGIIVHELYHAADPMADCNVTAKHIRKLANHQFGDLGIKKPEEALKELARQPEIEKILSSYGDERKRLIGIFQQQHESALADALMIIPEHYDAKKIAGIADVYLADGTPRRERDAVDFTDAIMRKNFGDSEPMRKNYSNASIQANADIAEPIIPKLTGEKFDTSGFRASTLGFDASELKHNLPPHVKPYHGSKPRVRH